MDMYVKTYGIKVRSKTASATCWSGQRLHLQSPANVPNVLEESYQYVA